MVERATQSLARAALTPLSVSLEHLESTLAILRGLIPLRPSFGGRISLDIGSSSSIVVDGQRGVVQLAERPRADAGIDVHPDDIVAMIKGDLDVRQALLFGQVRVTAGPVRLAVAFGDFLSGRSNRVVAQGFANLPRAVSDLAEARRDLDEVGYCMVADAIPRELRERLKIRVEEQAAAEFADGIAAMGTGGHDQRIWNLINKGAVFQELLESHLIDALVKPMLGEHFLLTSYSANIAGPGNSPGIMHYDQIYVRPPIREVAVGVNVAWFLDDVTESNGGTRLMPGSHRSGMAPEDPFCTEGTVAAEGLAGSALLFDSRLWHATGQNTSERRRYVILSYFNRSYMRTQENYFLSVPRESVDAMSERVKVMLGFRCTGSLGGVEGPIEGHFVQRPEAPIGPLGSGKLSG